MISRKIKDPGQGEVSPLWGLRGLAGFEAYPHADQAACRALSPPRARGWGRAPLLSNVVTPLGI